MIWATQFSTMGGLVGDPWIWAYPQHWCHQEYVYINFVTIFCSLFNGLRACSYWHWPFNDITLSLRHADFLIDWDQNKGTLHAIQNSLYNQVRTGQNFDLVHINGPVQNFGPPARNFGQQGVQPWALTKFLDFSLTILWFSLTMRHSIGISLLP